MERPNNLVFYEIGGIILLILLFFGGYMLSIQSHKPSTQTTKTAILPTVAANSTPTIAITPTASIETLIPTPTSLPGWKVYQNAQYGYSIQYPNTFKLYEAPGQIHSFIPQCDDTSLVTCLYLSPDTDNYPNFRGASVEINVVKKDEFPSKDIQTEADCKQYLTTRIEGSVSTEQLNGMTFYTGKFGQGATGHLIDEQLYAAYYKGYCFYIPLSITYDDVNLPLFTQTDTVFTQLHQVLSTFIFTK